MKRYLNRVFESSEEENRKAILRAVSEHGPFESMLDLGCYDGEVTMRVAAAAKSGSIAGLEMLEQHARQARERGVEVEIGDVERRFPYADGTFDLVHANQVIEHLRNTDAFLRECRRVCSPGGMVVLSTNNLASWHNVLTLTVGLQPMPIHVSDEIHVGNPINPRNGIAHQDLGQTHLRLFTGRALVELAGYHGLELIELRHSGYYPLPPSIARHIAHIDPLHSAFLVALLRPTGTVAAPSTTGTSAADENAPVSRRHSRSLSGAVGRARGLAGRRRGSVPSDPRSGAR